MHLPEKPQCLKVQHSPLKWHRCDNEKGIRTVDAILSDVLTHEARADCELDLLFHWYYHPFS